VFLVSGNDIYRGGLGSVDGKVDGGKGNDTLYGGKSNDDLMGAEGSDSLFGKGGEDTLNGGIGTDLLNGGKGQDHLLGGGQADDIYGGMGDDTLYGGGGADLLAGGRGDDVLSGGAGADIFVFNRNAGNALIADFTNGQDRIDLSNFGIEVANFPADLLAAATDLNSDFTLIALSMLGGDGSIIIKGLDFSLLGASDFIL
jgi:Ca2+-binding RTX toxin-like protein